MKLWTAWTKRAVFAGLIVVALVLSFPFLALATMQADHMWERFKQCRGNTQFDPAKWKDSTLVDTRTAPRECMVDDLLERRTLVGRQRTEVVALLGEPRPSGYFSNYDLVYWLGPERSILAIDSIWLVIKLDSGGRVIEARLATD